MAEIIEFKPKIKDTGLIDNSDLVDTRVLDPSSREFGYINGKKVMKPRTQYEYLMICKQFLTVEDYRTRLS